MMLYRFQIHRILLASLIVSIATIAQAGILCSPTDVPYSSGEAAADTYTADKAIDGDANTFCVLLDDSLDGTSTDTTPDYAASPTTGHMIFDLGEVKAIDGAKITARVISNVSAYGPKNVDFFYFVDDDPNNNTLVDDIENDVDIISLGNYTFSGIMNGASETVSWSEVNTRHIGMRINSSYVEGDVHYNFQLAEIEFSETEAVPEPSAVVLLLGVFVSLATIRRMKNKDAH